MEQSDIDNRFTYHPPLTANQRATYQSIRDIAKDTARFFDQYCPDSRELSLAITHLEEAVFWANAAIARN